MTRFQNEWTAFRVALMFYTRIPWSKSLHYSEAQQMRSIVYFPLVGWIVGGISALVFGISAAFLPPSVALVLSMIAGVLATGALHEDGFADSCDGFGAGWDKTQILWIMKDSTVGVYAVIGLGLLLALKFVALHATSVALIPGVLIAGHSLSRFLAASLLYTHTYARNTEDSKSQSMVKALSFKELLEMAAWGCFPIFFLLELKFFWLLLPLCIIRWGIGRYFQRRIGGYTGDCLGATQQLIEVSFYLLILLVIGSG